MAMINKKGRVEMDQEKFNKIMQVLIAIQKDLHVIASNTEAPFKTTLIHTVENIAKAPGTHDDPGKPGVPGDLNDFNSCYQSHQ